jgi:acetylglutamate kinase
MTDGDLPDPLQAHIARANILIEALPYMRQFRGATVVIKYGGAAMVDSTLKPLVIQDISLMSLIGMKPVVVHGGGPEITALLKRLGKQPQFIDGHRVTDEETLDVAEMVLAGKINSDIVMDLNRSGSKAIGLSGKDMNLLTARKKFHRDKDGSQRDIGFVGEVSSVQPEAIRILQQHDVIPVISPLGVDENGQGYNINADTAAAAIAGALGADKFVLLTDVRGVLRDRENPDSLIGTMTRAEVEAYISDGTIAGGMIPKVRACTDAIDAGCRKTHILDGRLPHSLLLELFTTSGIGTQIIP